MKLRIIIQTNEFGCALHLNGAVHKTIKSFDIEAPEVVEFLNDQEGYIYKTVLGVEVIKEDRAVLAQGAEDGGLEIKEPEERDRHYDRDGYCDNPARGY